MLISNIANLPEHSVLVFIAIASLDFMWMVTLLLFPLLVTLVVNHFVAVLVRVEFVMFVILVMLILRET